MQNLSSTLTEGDNPAVTQNRCCGHRRSSSLPVGPINDGLGSNGKRTAHGTKQNREKNFADLSGLVDTLNQISESLARPAKSLLEFLDRKNANFEKSTQQGKQQEDVSDGFSTSDQVQTALKQINIIQANLKHILPHMEAVLTDYKTTKQRTQSRDEMLKTLDKALRRSESQSRTLLSQLQDTRDENKCLIEKAQQNESILRYLEKGRDETSGEKRNKREKNEEDGGSKRVTRNKIGCSVTKPKSHSVLARSKSEVLRPGNITQCPEEEPGNKDLGAKLGHYQDVLRDYEKQLQEVVQLNKELVLKINQRENEVIHLNRELRKLQETLAIYEKGFKNLTEGSSEMDAMLREEKAKNMEMKEKLDDSDGYINCITDKVASYEVELQYLKQELRRRDENAS